MKLIVNGVRSLMVYGILVHISHTNVDAILLGVGHNQMRGVADSDDMGIGRKKRYSHSHNEGRAESFVCGQWARPFVHGKNALETYNG